jgi:hypothetical protein
VLESAGTYGKQRILVISVITVISTINATLLISPRILYGMPRDMGSCLAD